jgi:hypothetical protein
VVVNVQVGFPDGEVCWSIKAPPTSTQVVSELVTTVRVSAPPCLAYSVPPDEAVPAPPVNVAVVTLEACALSATPLTTTASTPGRSGAQLSMKAGGSDPGRVAVARPCRPGRLVKARAEAERRQRPGDAGGWRLVVSNVVRNGVNSCVSEWSQALPSASSGASRGQCLRHHGPF